MLSRSNAPASTDFKVLLGVMSNPTSPRLRNQLREWYAHFESLGNGVDVRYVFGATFHNGTDGNGVGGSGSNELISIPTLVPGLSDAAAGVRSEAETHDDLFYVDGRERLPHVGVVTEKSAAFWREVGDAHPGYQFYCKSDDDTMVHLDRLHATLAHVARSEGPDRPVYVGHMKWRGWDAGYRFQACGGTWGNAAKTKTDILEGGKFGKNGHQGPDYPPCPHAAGPYPYMSGGMVCMSAALQRLMARDKAFGDFLTVAKARNDHGERCRRPHLCAAQSASTHMWHHEDAGIGFNVFRAVVSANASASIVPVPGHYNDPGIIERSPSAQDRYWSSRALFVHGIKLREHYETALRRWTLSRASAHLTLGCSRNCSEHGFVGSYGWDWARLPCRRPRWSDVVQPGRFCNVDPNRHYRCCNWPWVLPELRTALLRVLADAPGQRLPVPKLVHQTRRAAAASASETPGCTGACASLEVPSGSHMHAVLEDLHARGDLTYSGYLKHRDDFHKREVWLIPR